ncbi:four-carbon acid sugar kinase family protein [Thalassococcus lentus]|uniref:Four-carbon acid sugar kinase family protein n=1 Tax=Thalassococcus lentus TaxID=1210524 RepID=A0ABT4XQQ7_9RHOB|nr:four-carbon acid sugar kinase family protein [Thalassococcus lentus]MDA7424281.1 four-carbon acid sugar kinase family protein [Thalassococcus lentus]
MTALPDGLLAAWYGDDFTGAAATMEVFAFAGLDAVLFVDVPTPEQIARFADARGIGIAGVSRSHSPQWMRRELPKVYQALAGLKAPFNFYKVCSTFDSAPDVGSIGCAVELALDHFQSDWMPMLVAAPDIGRWQVFGHLFAAGPGGNYRLDRHPVMARHPVTPMVESDLCRHLAAQTDLPSGLVSIRDLAVDGQGALGRVQQEARIVSLDAVDETSLAAAGALIWENRATGRFGIGSQGVLYALIAYWRAQGLLEAEPAVPSAGHTDRLVVVSGSASVVTAAQIDWALDNGFAGVRFDAAAVLGTAGSAEAEDQAVTEALQALERGMQPLIFAAKGPDDPAIAAFEAAACAAGMPLEDARGRIGAALGRVLRRLLEQTDCRRAIISGGDTSGHATQQLGIYALKALAPTIPAAALCRAFSENPRFDGLELALKGGQMGATDYFGAVRAGGGTQQEDQ